MRPGVVVQIERRKQHEHAYATVIAYVPHGESMEQAFSDAGMYQDCQKRHEYKRAVDRSAKTDKLIVLMHEDRTIGSTKVHNVVSVVHTSPSEERPKRRSTRIRPGLLGDTEEARWGSGSAIA